MKVETEITSRMIELALKALYFKELDPQKESRELQFEIAVQYSVLEELDNLYQAITGESFHDTAFEIARPELQNIPPEGTKCTECGKVDDITCVFH